MHSTCNLYTASSCNESGWFLDTIESVCYISFNAYEYMTYCAFEYTILLPLLLLFCEKNYGELSNARFPKNLFSP